MNITRRLTESLNSKYNKLTESCVEEWWGQTDEDPFEFARNYNLTCDYIDSNNDEILYRFTGSKEDIDAARGDGYFYSMDYGQDNGHSEDLDEGLSESVNVLDKIANMLSEDLTEEGPRGC